jgi:hypothetical protein
MQSYHHKDRWRIEGFDRGFCYPGWQKDLVGSTNSVIQSVEVDCHSPEITAPAARRSGNPLCRHCEHSEAISF